MAEMLEPRMLQRHSFVRVHATAWASFVALRPDLAGEPLIVDWVKRGFPLIARRGAGGADSDLVALGLPLPPSHGKRRIVVALPHGAILSTSQPPLLADAAHIAPPAWRGDIERLVALSPEVRCFGSLAWQYLTGLHYLSATSDLDLLWHLSDSHRLEELLAGIAALDAAAPMRIDGEIVAPAGGVNWRELREITNSEVLLKSLEGVSMLPREMFLTGAAT
jgi:phosphoribosyl-dephospho-CoA transferase